MRNSIFSFHKMSILSFLLVAVAAVLGADSSFAMAVDPIVEAEPANPSGNMNEYDADKNPEGRPADEALQEDEQGNKTQLQGKAATATDARDAGLEAEDYDADVDNFRKFRFPEETYFARMCRPVKVSSYVHGHFRSGSTDLESVYIGSPIKITAGTDTSGVYTNSNKQLKIAKASLENAFALTEFSTISVEGVEGFKKDEDGNEVSDGTLILFVLNHKDESDNVIFKVMNPPVNTTGTATSITIPTDARFYVMSTACAESQMHVASETYLPVKNDVYLQKKIVTCVITDEFEGQDKKVSHKTKQVLANAEYNFKRKCARSHWNGTMSRTDVYVPETGNREAVYMENGILRQIPMLYSHGDNLADDDLLAMTTLMFTNNAVSDEAVVFCGKKALQRLIKLVNSNNKYKDVSKVEVNDYGIKVRKYRDNFGSLEFVWSPTLDDLGYEQYMVGLDLRHATRPYKVNDKRTTRDMSKTGEAREAKEYNLCRIDCIALNGYNAFIACPSSVAIGSAANLGGIEANFVSVAALPVGDGLTAEAKTKKYYLTAADGSFAAGDIVEWDADLAGWVKFEGLIRA